MFSPDSSVHGVRNSTKNPRRRPRDSDSLRQLPKRKRSKLSEEAFTIPHGEHTNGKDSPSMNGHAGYGSIDGSLVVVDMPVREKKTTLKRVTKEDSGVLLTKCENYSVRKLPSFPTQLSSAQVPFRAFALPAVGHALALTAQQAFVWDYTLPTGLPKVHVLTLPFHSKAVDRPPLGAIVRSGPSNDFGIVVVSPSTGRIIYWENVDTAEAGSHFSQRQTGVEGSVGRMSSGVAITDMVEIEHAGFILIFSDGRLAQLTLRDAQGRPSVNVRFLENPAGNRGILSKFGWPSGFRKEIAAVQARQSLSKGQVEVITATRKGVFNLWDLSWSGQHIFRDEVDIHAELVAALLPGASPEFRKESNLNVLDFAILQQPQAGGSQVSVASNRQDIELLLLVALSYTDSTEYSLVEIDLANQPGVVRRHIPLRNFHHPQVITTPKGRLLLPYPGHTALVQFDSGIVVASLAEVEQSPDAQILSDSGKPSLPYQDTIYFRKERNVYISGLTVELVARKDKQSSALFFIEGYGVVQLCAFPPPPDDSDVERQKVTALSKLTQATFFGSLSGNIIDFSIQGRYSFAQQDVESAAEHISKAVLRSSIEFVEAVSSSMEDQLRRRCGALRSLINQLRSDYPPLSFQTKWQLLADAEKLWAALHLWRMYEEQCEHSRKKSSPAHQLLLLPQLVTILNERYKTEIQKERGENDPVRHYFLKDLDRLQIILPWAWQILRTHYSEVGKDRAVLIQKVSEADDIILSTFESAFQFREDNIELYGIDPDVLEDGVLKSGRGYNVLPELWTSTHNNVHAIRHLVDAGRSLAIETFENSEVEDIARKVAQENPRMVKLCCRTHMERFLWLLDQTEEENRDRGRKLQQEFDEKVRPTQIFELLNIGMAEEAMHLAEGYRDMPTLVKLVWEEINYYSEVKAATSSAVEESESKIKLKKMKRRIQGYFDQYGGDFAEAFYAKFIAERCPGRLFMKDYLNQPALTKFLRVDASRGKIAWINEVCGENNFKGAGQVLLQVAKQQESNAWCQKVQLSIAKLSLLCEDDSEEVRNLTKAVEAELEVSKNQEHLHDALSPVVSGALDDDSALQLVMEQFGQGRWLSDRPTHQQLLKQGFEELINRRILEPALLVDVLTLIDYDPREDGSSLGGATEFSLALEVMADAWGSLDKTTRESSLRLAWKRLYIVDDWPSVNLTKGLMDKELQQKLAGTVLGQTLIYLYRFLLKDNADGALERYNILVPPSPSSVLGAGCTNEELRKRFPSEDLRNPIIADNLEDDGILQSYIEKHRLDQWFQDTKQLAQHLGKEPFVAADDETVLDMEDTDTDGPGSLVEEEHSSEATEGPEGFEGDDEQSANPSVAASVVEHDVEMEDA